MPLPKSLICVSCKHTYPEGWKRCPYCGYDEKIARQEAEAKRAARQAEKEKGGDRGRGRRRERRPGAPVPAVQVSPKQRPAAPRKPQANGQSAPESQDTRRPRRRARRRRRGSGEGPARQEGAETRQLQTRREPDKGASRETFASAVKPGAAGPADEPRKKRSRRRNRRRRHGPRPTGSTTGGSPPSGQE